MKTIHTVPFKPAKRLRFFFGFSLLEMLVVISIMAILIVAAIPVFANTSSNARQASREIIKAHLQQARAHAISSGNATALAIPVLNTGKELGARAITLFEVEYDGSNYTVMEDPDTGQQAQLLRWQKLPGSFHFISATDITGSNATIMDSTARLETAFKGENISCHLIVFSSNGQIVRPAEETNIIIAQAVRQGESLRFTEKNGTEPVYEIFQVNRLTGRTRPIRR
ncbi:MAG: prepilin-type N-terminal cleavage/methylation domain-containing protein [Akkermansiaceae bacterium]|jgi:prepilin-type N-terminal cleavage/methylation domain-containing protein|nr:prepilin-type N-terminal cleavage/methylation domain-containing protein [Akkermansiaceae bacterium]MDP4721254.1 prepilin-type N-terminal cleavage/methylation domain-containing protein [Akkermansiaceae bacterium]MDP4778722.1 prepilin-type N-terminal cleavage/methylation domain-containing protein [Akkermansiaceae bacterium]MDP4897873.1 prepilin-type N-terminal cleavage/methylation domain-containing protein [Akkermansiaceae bacterium]MDP4996920.1 prepilin-type N-terminal cleavage/methylation do